jgi:signal transduction protein with GAF and PtsI domain
VVLTLLAGGLAGYIWGRLGARSLARRLTTADAAADVGRSLMISVDLDDVARRIVEACSTVVACDAAELRVPAADGSLVLLHETGFRSPSGLIRSLRPDDGVSGQAFLQGGAMSTTTAQARAAGRSEFDKWTRREGFAGQLAAPIIGGEARPLGVLTVFRRGSRAFDDTEREALVRLAAWAAAAMSQASRVADLNRRNRELAHKFNNLFAVALGRVELLLDDEGDLKNRRESLESIRRAALEGRELARGLTASARQQSARHPVDRPEAGPVNSSSA